MTGKKLPTTTIALLLALGVIGTASAHAQNNQGGSPMDRDMRGGQMQGPMSGQQMQPNGQQGPMMGQGQGGQMGPNMMMGQQGSMMNPAMMMGHHRSMMNNGMMGSGMMRDAAMMGLGNRVVPLRDLEKDDVEHFLEHRIELQGYSRLKVGKIEEKDDDTITAEIVTEEGAIVQRLEVDRHNGSMQEIK